MKFYNAAFHLVPIFGALCIGSLCSFVHADDTSPSEDDVSASTGMVNSAEADTIIAWWATVDEAERSKLSNLFYPTWFDALEETQQAGYAHVAHTLYEFVDSGEDSHPHDGYIGFSPLLLRTSFHGAGSLDVPSGTGGTNGGTIFSSGELEDEGNTCIDITTQRLQRLLDTNPLVSKADALVIAGSVALDDMEFPRMDLLRITGGRKDDTTDIAFRNRLPEASENPTALFTNAYNLTLKELTALIGGAHNFGSAHGVCSGYVGQWTTDPLKWNGSVVAGSVEDGTTTSAPPEFFPDLMREDWRWYEVCTYQNGTSMYESIDDPFANGALPSPSSSDASEEDFGEDSSDDGEEEEAIAQCDIENNEVPFKCEDQAMRGCNFEDGSYDATESPCDLSVLQFRLKSDFFLKADPDLRPFAELFAGDSAALAEQFGIAYHKLTHAGLRRCGFLGSLADGCGEFGTCVGVYGDDGQYVTSQCEIDETRVVEAAMEALEAEAEDDKWSLDHTGSIFVLVALVISVFGFVFLAAKTTSSSPVTAVSVNRGKAHEATTTGEDDKVSQLPSLMPEKSLC